MLAARPLATDPGRALALATEALRENADPGEPYDRRIAGLARELEDGSASGTLLVARDTVVGVALWSDESPLGATVEVVHLGPGLRDRAGYLAALDVVVGAAGPIAFLPGRFAGVPDPELAEWLAERGYAPFERTEMRYPPDRPPPPDRPVLGVSVAPVEPRDRPALIALHERAYAAGFDRYLFLVDLDPAVDARRQIDDLLGGRWGEFLGGASAVARANGAVIGASLVVRAAYGPLLADVMVDPGHRGRGVGRCLVGANLRALRARGESVAVLNVTEGNGPAVRLYARIGFVRTLGPGRGFYATARIPVPPRA